MGRYLEWSNAGWYAPGTLRCPQFIAYASVSRSQVLIVQLSAPLRWRWLKPCCSQNQEMPIKERADSDITSRVRGKICPAHIAQISTDARRDNKQVQTQFLLHIHERTKILCSQGKRSTCCIIANPRDRMRTNTPKTRQSKKLFFNRA